MLSCVGRVLQIGLSLFHSITKYLKGFRLTELILNKKSKTSITLESRERRGF
jgi:hypothetical protein